jgi:hypothetical protein
MNSPGFNLALLYSNELQVRGWNSLLYLHHSWKVCWEAVLKSLTINLLRCWALDPHRLCLEGNDILDLLPAMGNQKYL